MNRWPDLRHILKEIPWVVVGGVATRAYMPERMTQDLDILVRQADQVVVVEKLQAAGFEYLSPLAIPGVLMKSPDGVEVDVLFGDMPWAAQALQHPRHDAAGFPVLDLPYLVLMKMDAMRTQDWADIARMLGGASVQVLDAVRQVIQEYSPQDSEDLEALIYLGQQEYRSR